mmetsp:Transcript_38563/g.64715  ORF Transcript_38563/g.64715 Transcript_38563/m.64715 type:complete len:88 (-) Transcript_38563:1049-1312(-)
MAVRKLLRADANATMEHANIDAKDVLATASPQPSSSFFSSSRRRRRRSGADSSKTNSRAREVFMMLQQVLVRNDVTNYDLERKLLFP